MHTYFHNSLDKVVGMYLFWEIHNVITILFSSFICNCSAKIVIFLSFLVKSERKMLAFNIFAMI